MDRVNGFSTALFSVENKKRVRELVVQGIILPATFINFSNDAELIETLQGILHQNTGRKFISPVEIRYYIKIYFTS